MPESYVQVPMDSTGKKLRHRERVLGGNTVYEQAVFQGALPTFYVLADAVAPAQNKQVLSAFNDTGSGVVLELRKLFMINNQLAAVTGVAIRMEVKRATGHSGGTSITAQTADSANSSLPAQVTFRTAGSVTESSLLFPITLTNDEVGVTQAFPSTQMMAGFNWAIEGPEVQGLRLREGEGLTIKQITNSAVGSISWLAVFTADDA